ncbi:hypothetical protein C8A00DRAFT_44498 [Chaetomidium leptoderma]|uniref:IBR domain-containing protein n=1 Tax=Chaetomidium leptoderma TaxID=669021 RepID=A0AAN6VJJ9_9PEZI|nr:hypothetical protein C8A00DRAFT_44498 [Chaetomidium leptoderma]
MSGESHQCAACFDDVVIGGGGVHPICHNLHTWCLACIKTSIATAVRNISDASCMPPRCCGDTILPMERISNTREHPAQAVDRVRAVQNVHGVFISRSIIRMAMNSKTDLYQFCQRCHRLVTRSEGCNHIRCLCGHHFCILCGNEWPTARDEAGSLQGLCHPFYGDADKHVLRVPAEIQARLDEEDNKAPPALANKDAQGNLCRHPRDMLYRLRLRREFSIEERKEARCELCARLFKAFLLQCQVCRTLLCLDCLDQSKDGPSNGKGNAGSGLAIGGGESSTAS